jgi:hypothetical protein
MPEARKMRGLPSLSPKTQRVRKHELREIRYKKPRIIFNYKKEEREETKRFKNLNEPFGFNIEDF